MATTVERSYRAPSPRDGHEQRHRLGLDVQGAKAVAAEGAPRSTASMRPRPPLGPSSARLTTLGAVELSRLSPRSKTSRLSRVARGAVERGVLSATASSTAVPATCIGRGRRLAQAQKLSRRPLRRAPPWSAPALTITSGGKTFNVVIDSTNNTVLQDRGRDQFVRRRHQGGRDRDQQRERHGDSDAHGAHQRHREHSR